MRAVGAVESRKAANARIRIVSFKRKNAFVTDEDEIKEAFLPDGYVFAPVLPEKFELNDLIEFQTIQAPYSSKSTDDALLLDKNGGCNFAGYEVIPAPFSILTDGCSVDTEQIDASDIRPYCEFYLLINSFLYGPLKKQADYVQPVKEIFQIPADGLDFYPTGNKLYLLRKPDGTIKCDAMNMEQLGDWFKDQLSLLGASADLQVARQAVQNYTLTGLDSVRLSRAARILDQLLLNAAELKTVATLLPQLKSGYENALDKVYEEIAAPLERQAAGLRQQLNTLEQEKQAASRELSAELDLLSAATEQLNHIRSEKDRLIADIRVQTLVYPQTAARSAEAAMLKYDVQDFTAEGMPYVSVTDFIKTFKQSLAAGQESLGKTGHVLLLLLKDYRCLLSAAIAPVLQIARLSNNAKIILQQVEPDWLKFDFLYHNGLRHAWASAQAQPEVIHLFILTDINLASPECYARPLNDILAGLRKSLPGLSGGFPTNLWIFGVPTLANPGQDFGLPLMKNTFRHWGAVPAVYDEWEFTTENSGLRLMPTILTDHDEMAASAPDDYFPQG